MDETGSTTLFFGFLLLLALTIGLAALSVHRAAASNPSKAPQWRAPLLFLLGVGIVMAASGVAASRGVLQRFDTLPPPAMVVFLGSTVVTVVAVLSPFGKHLARATPMVWLIGFQAFRLPLELLLHKAWRDGVLPEQLTFSGLNFDILTGVAALVMGIVLSKRGLPRWSIFLFAGLGLALLLNVVGVAVASMPLFAAFGPDRVNTGVLVVPYVWLPVVFVQFALAGHLLIFRKLKLEASPAGRGA